MSTTKDDDPKARIVTVPPREAREVTVETTTKGKQK
jgi:hypothetical protein